METKTFINTVFYCGTSAMQLQLTTNGIFIDVAPSAGKNKFDWSKKVGTKLSLSEVSNLLYSLEILREKGEQAYFTASQEICGSKDPRYKNMQFCHDKVRTGFNVNNGYLNFVIKNPSAKIDVSFPVLAAEKIKLEKVLEKIVSVAIEKSNEILTRKQKAKLKEKSVNAPVSTNIVNIAAKQKDQVKIHLIKKLSNVESNSELEVVRLDFYCYCIKYKFDFSFVEIEKLFIEAEKSLQSSIQTN